MFLYPSAGNPRVAVLASGFRETRSVRCFRNAADPALREFDPDVLAGTPAQLRRIALGTSPLRLRNAVIALIYEGEEGLREEDRDLFWNVFGVPVFEQYLTAGNELIASECEAHDRMHAAGAILHSRIWAAEDGCCACGEKRALVARAAVARSRASHSALSAARMC